MTKRDWQAQYFLDATLRKLEGLRLAYDLHRRGNDDEGDAALVFYTRDTDGGMTVHHTEFGDGEALAWWVVDILYWRHFYLELHRGHDFMSWRACFDDGHGSDGVHMLGATRWTAILSAAQWRLDHEANNIQEEAAAA